MPPRTRTKLTKVLKENASAVRKSNLKSDGKVSKPPRKALADKTNSLSDDNASIDVPVKSRKTTTKNNILKEKETTNTVRPRRDRRIPTRYVENVVLNSLSNSKDASIEQTDASNKIVSKQDSKAVFSKKVEPKETITHKVRPKRNCRLQFKENVNSKTPNKSTSISSPFKTPTKTSDSSLVLNRPKRICRLPSKFEDHSISPSKFIPVQPCYSSTPIHQKPVKTVTKANKNTSTAQKEANSIKNYFRNAEKCTIKETKTKTTSSKSSTNIKNAEKKSPDNNNNAKSKTVVTRKGKVTKLSTKQVSPTANKKSPTKRILNKSLSFRVLDDKNRNDNVDVYEFTYDPKEEPVPQKKKRKRTVNKKPPKPKTVLLKNNYDRNLSKAMEALKNKVKPSQSQTVATETTNNTQNVKQKEPLKQTLQVPNLSFAPSLPAINESAKTSIHESNYASIRIEDIAAEFEVPEHNNVNYSPVNSPCHPKTPDHRAEVVNQVNDKDPLNLRESFFDDIPIASSSMNTSVRHPTASPWRVEFGNLPIKWNADTYVKPNMTPAVECSFINSEDRSKKKHVYTNIVPEVNESLPQVESNNSNLVQTSIISFIKEVAERQANKKKRGRSVSPGRAHALFEDTPANISTRFGYQTPKKAKKSNVVETPKTPNLPENTNNKSKENEKSNNSETAKTGYGDKNQDKDVTYFGFDESENKDQENVSPKKGQRNRLRNLRSKSRAALQEINNQGPTRSVFPVTRKKMASSEMVNKLYEQLKSAEDAPSLPEKATGMTLRAQNTHTTVDEQINEDSDSVHLFEDIELVHHLKLARKSYGGKTKKVAFQQSYSDSDDQDSDVVEQARSDDEEEFEDDLADLSFHMPEVEKKKKKKPKKKLTKKEEKEAEEWAASFNSMCEDIDEFPLVVE